jgi:hypothetical protein
MSVMFNVYCMWYILVPVEPYFVSSHRSFVLLTIHLDRFALSLMTMSSCSLLAVPLINSFQETKNKKLVQE